MKTRSGLVDLPLAKVFTCIEQGPVLLVTTRDGRKNNVMTITWSSVLDFTGHFCIVTGSWNYSCRALLKNSECVVAIPPATMLETAVDIGMCSGADTDKFRRFGLTALKAQEVKAPLLGECLANIECRVSDYVTAHNIFVLAAVKAWINPACSDHRIAHAIGDGTFTIDGERVNLRSRMAEKIPDGV
ncbi:MAG: flavin reductase family protein [Oligosphaeraceae bacterium]|nr:flavin reductase family protein [Oligosphaeraceae bacterium]